MPLGVPTGIFINHFWIQAAVYILKSPCVKARHVRIWHMKMCRKLVFLGTCLGNYRGTAALKQEAISQPVWKIKKF